MTPEAVRPICGAEEESGERKSDEEGGEDVDEGTVRGPKYIRDIRTPTQEEVERRNLTHLPFRNWCPRCMMGRGKEAPHRRVMGGQGELPEISLDFCFPSREGGTGALTILVAKERHFKMLLACVVPSKTTGTFTTSRVWAFLREIGCKHGDIILKSDQEPAIMSLVSDISKMRSEKVA